MSAGGNIQCELRVSMFYIHDFGANKRDSNELHLNSNFLFSVILSITLAFFSGLTARFLFMDCA